MKMYEVMADNGAVMQQVLMDTASEIFLMVRIFASERCSKERKRIK